MLACYQLAVVAMRTKNRLIGAIMTFSDIGLVFFVVCCCFDLRLIKDGF